MKNLKYIPKDYLQDFLVGMSNYDTETLLTDLSVCELLDGKVPEDHNPDVPPYQAAEAFLVLFQEREEYELCTMILKKWPKLKNEEV
tara:strand:- start:228 stop:488 length:261 start_codon:yes stop_codon:yes gene_type:complete